MRQIIAKGAPGLKKRYLALLVEDIVLDGRTATVRGKTETVVAMLDQEEELNGELAPVLSSIQKWRPDCVVKKYWTHTFSIFDEDSPENIIRFDQYQIDKWVAELAAADAAEPDLTSGVLPLARSIHV